MKFSFQTVWIFFGVTLAHLVVISALSPAVGERRDLVSKVDPDPANSLRKQAEANTDSATGMAVTAVVAPKEETAEITRVKDSSAVTAGEVSVPPPGALTQSPAPVESLVETATAERSAVTVDPPAISSPPRVIREIRDLKPVRRS